jgi:hypothetical protein
MLMALYQLLTLPHTHPCTKMLMALYQLLTLPHTHPCTKMLMALYQLLTLPHIHPCTTMLMALSQLLTLPHTHHTPYTVQLHQIFGKLRRTIGVQKRGFGRRKPALVHG